MRIRVSSRAPRQRSYMISTLGAKTAAEYEAVVAEKAALETKVEELTAELEAAKAAAPPAEEAPAEE